MIGENIGHYRITGKLGEGGMGEVYRATDSKLGREVAIKVLPDAFANDRDRMARFQREAQVGSFCLFGDELGLAWISANCTPSYKLTNT